MALQLFKIADVTVATPQASIDFTSIPQGYTDLKIVISSRAALTGFSFVFGGIRFNSDTNTYSGKSLFGNGSTVSSSSYSTNFGYVIESTAANATANTFGNAEIYIPNYTNSNQKSFSSDQVAETNATATESALSAGLWSQTGAITSITLYPGGGSYFIANTTATLYGVL